MKGHAPVPEKRSVAYFSMEIGLDPGMPTYSGGLGVLAGDTIRSAADLKVPMVAISLLYRKGYFFQRIDDSGWQTEDPVEWIVEDYLQERPPRVTVTIEGRNVALRCWRYQVSGADGHIIPVYFLDADLPENSEWDRKLTHSLYGGDSHYRLCQEVILGIGGVKMLRALGYHAIEKFHMNEGHASLLTLELLREEAVKAGRHTIIPGDLEAVRRKCIFTTHTPVPAGHDQFPLDMAHHVLGAYENFFDDKDLHLSYLAGRIHQNENGNHKVDALNMTYLALNLSHYVNGVAKKHGEVSRVMFEGYDIESITNGVHAATWTSEPFQDLFDRHIHEWRQDNFSLRYALSIPPKEVWEAHLQAKRKLLQYVRQFTNVAMDDDHLTIGFARRAATYKRADLIFTDLDRLKRIQENAPGPIQIIFAGKAHPNDHPGKELIQRVYQMGNALRNEIRIVFLENYDMELGKLLTSGADIWLNTPQPPLEASGTSGMKAALNGVPSLSILDGWWLEGCIEGVTGWGIGEKAPGSGSDGDRSRDAASLYDKLEKTVIPLFYQHHERFLDVMRHTIALNGSFFNTHRMVQQYVLSAYFR
jgi:starch phosphorylase